MSLRKNDTYTDEAGNEKRRKISVPQATWERVVEEALKLYPIGKIIKNDSARITVHFSQPPSDPQERVAFHNMLVQCCQVSLRQWGEALDKESGKKRKAPETESLKDD